MSEIDVFTKLSRILETNNFSDDKIIDDNSSPDRSHSPFSPKKYQIQTPITPGKSPSRTTQSPAKQNMNITHNGGSITPGREDRPSPYEVWKTKQQSTDRIKDTMKLSGQQWDKLVDKMHQINRTKESSMVREQNHGLALELGGYEFRPRMNQTSLDLSKSMKKIEERLPEMLENRKKILQRKREDKAIEEMQDCTFKPERFGSKKSDQYLKRMGREKSKPSDFTQYRDDQLKRNNQRKQILEEIEGRELTFAPLIPANSNKIDIKCRSNNSIAVDPITRIRATNRDTSTAGDINKFTTASPLLLESDHPYKHNTSEYTTIFVPGAVSYSITFDERTATENIYDFVRFFQDETHTLMWGNGKYTGGVNHSASNWPGLNGRPALIIPAGRFVVQFKTNNVLNGWGFAMVIVPTVSLVNAGQKIAGQPEISKIGKNYHQGNGKVHERLYKLGVKKAIEQHNNQAELTKTKLNISLKPWEEVRSSDNKSNGWIQKSQSKLTKDLLDEVNGGVESSDTNITIVEYDDSYMSIWRNLKSAEILQGFSAHASDNEEEYDYNNDSMRTTDL